MPQRKKMYNIMKSHFLKFETTIFHEIVFIGKNDTY